MNPDSPATGRHTLWSRLAWLGVYAVAMGLLEAICVVYLRRLLPLDTGSPIAGLEKLRIEIPREICTIVMLVAVAWLSGVNVRTRVAAFFFAFGIWDILYYIGLWWWAGWPESLWTWDCLFLIPQPWYGPVLAPVLISLYFILGCCWLWWAEQEQPVRWTSVLVFSQLLAFALWFWSFVQDSHAISVHGYKGVTYSWWLLVLGGLVGAAGLWHGWRKTFRR